ncbi:MAG TPA: hypothetical protein VFA11_04285 [Acidimicrobiales bacterium]|nr:hypothetical protein [Acidimicrobiales bacterium]
MREKRDKFLKAVMGGVCAYELTALIAEEANFGHPKTISVLTSRSKVLRGAMAVGYVILGVHVGHMVKGH